MTPMVVSIDLAPQLGHVPWGLATVLVISGAGVLACTDAPDRVRRTCAALLTRIRFRLLVQYVRGERLRNVA